VLQKQNFIWRITRVSHTHFQIHMTGGIRWITAGLLLSVTIHSSSPASAETESAMQQLRLAMDVAIGQPAATVLNQCRAIALGVKTCGGPREYLLYSTEVTETRTLHDLVDKFNRCDHDRNKRLELASDCEFVVEPTLVLKDGVCSVKIPRSN